MKANTNRANRLAFDSVATSYDSSRPAMSDKVVSDLMTHANLRSGSRVLEVGAGTGQLTIALLDRGLQVTALEPGDALRERLIEKTKGHNNVVVRPDLFEEYSNENNAFDAIVSANAWHWVDPSVGYSRAANLLRPRGALGVIWNFPLLSDQMLRDRLNKEVFSGKGNWPDLAKGNDHFDSIQASALEGRKEIVESNLFSDPWWTFHEENFSLTIDMYIEFLKSYANVAISSAERQIKLREDVLKIVGNCESIDLTNFVYIAVSHEEKRDIKLEIVSPEKPARKHSSW
ncbi:MAG TPA: class I SAM-dependent methyltransferase [Candidatus Baltobacteraceae bacterium]|jgi:SAM-dependent methyltransferase|nr:class I SAM-dependent methyltransferase [Candidatus Baltobacteraceae bacterium]